MPRIVTFALSLIFTAMLCGLQGCVSMGPYVTDVKADTYGVLKVTRCKLSVWDFLWGNDAPECEEVQRIMERPIQ